MWATDLHSWWGWVTVVLSGVVGLAGVLLGLSQLLTERRLWRQRQLSADPHPEPERALPEAEHPEERDMDKSIELSSWQRLIWWLFPWGVIGAVIALVGQVLLGIYSLGVEGVSVGDWHVFYGVLVAISLALGYVFRVQLQRRPQLYIGLLLLFVMGLGLRSISNVSDNF